MRELLAPVVRERFEEGGAVDYIPMTVGLAKRLEVVNIARATGRSRQEVIGWLYELWSWASNETLDGTLMGLDAPALSQVIGADECLWRAVIDQRWLIQKKDGLRLPKFERWLSKGAKIRLKEREKKRRQRGDSVPNEQGQCPSSFRARARDIKDLLSCPVLSLFCSSRSKLEETFRAFWESYPRKVGRKKVWEWWVKRKPSSWAVAVMLAAIERQCRSRQWRDQGGKFIPHPLTWLNRAGWEDELDPDEPCSGGTARFAAEYTQGSIREFLRRTADDNRAGGEVGGDACDGVRHASVAR